ncbi:C2 calcium/lipid-binding plant phosphoribosyltransferase family protein [Theobroma cacao]|uniref:C2 calcium/lipid-binding plant phosphoribosyltransferase family protein n=1 Tax=Theobroma cacao TaxID=3641 RepID=A0A061DW86_THECC|nr:C2 calcium/lipid-binding plant phosphoribosyltransferase family protein [Theobroma cacao]
MSLHYFFFLSNSPFFFVLSGLLFQEIAKPTMNTIVTTGKEKLVEVVAAHSLMPKDRERSSSPFVEVEFENQRHRTKIIEVNVFNERSSSNSRNFLKKMRVSGSSIAKEGEEAPQMYTLDKRSLFSHTREEITLKLYVSTRKEVKEVGIDNGMMVSASISSAGPAVPLAVGGVTGGGTGVRGHGGRLMFLLDINNNQEGNKDDLFGRVWFDLSDVLKKVPFDSQLAPKWYRMENRKEDKSKGEVMLPIWFGTQDHVELGRDEVVGRVLLLVTAIEKGSDHKQVVSRWFNLDNHFGNSVETKLVTPHS